MGKDPIMDLLDLPGDEVKVFDIPGLGIGIASVMKKTPVQCVGKHFPISAYGARCPSCYRYADGDTMLVHDDWEVLKLVERIFYENQHSLHPFTEVNSEFEDHKMVVEMWLHAEGMFDSSTTRDECPAGVRAETAKRVALALRMLAGGY